MYPQHNDFAPIYIALVCISASLLCYYITIHTVKSKFPSACVTLPLLLLTPFSLLFVVLAKVFPASFDLKAHVSNPLLFLYFLAANAIFIAELYCHYYCCMWTHLLLRTSRCNDLVVSQSRKMHVNTQL